MQNANPTPHTNHRAKIPWLKAMLIALAAEKFVQHVVVTAAFFFDWDDIGSTVVVNPNVLMVLGALVAILFAISLWGLVTQQRWAVDLLIGLALFDIVGEFVAQGTLGILITFSFIVATVLLIAALLCRRQTQTRA